MVGFEELPEWTRLITGHDCVVRGRVIRFSVL